MLAYGKAFERNGALGGLRRIILRCARLYLFQIGLLLTRLVVVLLWTAPCVAPILLQTTPGKTVSYEHVADCLRGLFRHYNIAKIGFDRWNMRQFVKDHFVEFGQGMQSMSPALRDLEEVLLEGQIAHGNHPVLSMCASNTVIAVDDAGNRKPSKKRSIGRIDGIVALAMAVGVAPLKAGACDRRSGFDRIMIIFFFCAVGNLSCSVLVARRQSPS
jgi:hypothetical protein